MADYDLQYQDTHIDALLATANELKTAGYIYKGVATPSTNPGTVTERCAYIASEAGTYTNFGSLSVTGLSVLTYNGSAWSATLLDIALDVEQTKGTSTTAVMSQKAVTDELITIDDKIYADQVVDISQLSPVLGYISNTGGWTVSASTSKTRTLFVPVTPGKTYIMTQGSGSGTQYYTILDTLFNTASSQSQSAIDYATGYSGRVTLNAGSSVALTVPNDGHYLVVRADLSGGSSFAPTITEKIAVKDMIEEKENVDLSSLTILNNWVGATGSPVSNEGSKHIVVDVSNNEAVEITAGLQATYYTWASVVSNASWTPMLATRYTIDANTTSRSYIPQGANYLIIGVMSSSSSGIDYTPASVILISNILDRYKSLDDEVSDVRDGYLYHTTQLDTTSMTKTARSLGNDDKWLNNNGCNHVVIPCQEGDTFVLTASSDTATGGFYGWLTDAYTPPTSASSIPYVRNNTRIWLSTVNCPATITAPPDAAYLCLVTKDGNGNVVIWTGTMKRLTLLDNILSSELKDEITTDLSNDIGKYVMQPSSYIPTKETATKLMNITGQQGSALYGDYLAVWYLGNKLNIYDVRAKTSVALNVALPTFANTRLHANTMSFGAKYDANDTLPLLYICSGYTDTTSVSTSEVYVVRITESGGTYTATLIQTITLDFGRVNGWTEFVVDAVESRAWINGCPTASYICVALPDTSQSAVTIDNTTTIIDKFNVKAPKVFGTSTASSGQGRFFWHNRVYYVSGVPSYEGQGEDSLYLIVDNCITHCTEAVVALKNFGLASGTSNTYEPEGCFIWEDEMYIVYRTFVYRLNRN